MKKIFLTVASFLAVTAGYTQDCKTNLYMTNNAKMQMTMYDKKGAASGTRDITVTGVKKSQKRFYRSYY